MLLPRRPGAVVSALTVTLALVGSLLLLAPSASAASTGRVRGAVYGADGIPSLVMQWFTRDWKYLGKRKIHNGVYSLDLAPGTYRLQFVDQRPAYNLKKYAPADALVTVRAAWTTTKSVRMHRGAAVFGVAKAGGRPAKGARVVAANTYEQSYPVVANKKGQFAIGGLPPGRYSVFTYDRAKKWVGRSAFVGGLKLGQAVKVSPSLKVRAGRLLVDLYAGDASLTARVNATVTSLATGQWWSANSSGGSVSFGGLYPGRYKITVPGVGVWFGRSGRVSGGKVRAGRVAFGSFRLTQRGGWVTGRVVDSADTTKAAYPMGGVHVVLKNAANSVVATTTTTSSGSFTLAGQLGAQSGMTVVITPNNGNDSWMQGQKWCMFAGSTHSGVSIRTDTATTLGTLTLPRSRSPQQTEQCQVS